MTIARREFLMALAATGGAVLTGCAGTPAQKGIRGYNTRVVDMHTHWYPPEFVELLVREGPANGAEVAHDGKGNVALEVPGGNELSRIGRRDMIDLGIIIKSMDERGIDVNMLSQTNPMVYWAPPAFGLKLSQTWNDACAAAHLKYPERLIGTICLPMQDPKLALQELERAAKLPGMHSVWQGESVNGKNVHDKSFWPIYARCEQLEIPICMHTVFAYGKERLSEFALLPLLGNPYEAGVAASVLIFGGVLDAFPKLIFTLPHAGGTYPWLIGRLDYAYHVGVPEVQNIKQPPSAYLRRFYYDSIIHNPQRLKLLADIVGADRIVVGSDYNQVLTYKQPVDFIESVPGLSTNERELILGGNAARILKLG